MTKEHIILVDTREPKNLFTQLNKLHPQSELNTLPIGDFSIPQKGIIIERKSIPDLVSSVRSGHLMKQIIQMQQFPYSYLIISGKLSDLRFKEIKGWTVDQHLGIIASITARTNTRVLWVENDSQLIKLVLKLGDKVSDGRVYSVEDTELLKTKLSESDMRKRILRCFDGVGPKKADKLLSDSVVCSVLESFLDVMIDTGVYKP